MLLDKTDSFKFYYHATRKVPLITILYDPATAQEGFSVNMFQADYTTTFVTNSEYESYKYTHDGTVHTKATVVSIGGPEGGIEALGIGF